jgi:hypothetical protein
MYHCPLSLSTNDNGTGTTTASSIRRIDSYLCTPKVIELCGVMPRNLHRLQLYCSRSADLGKHYSRMQLLDPMLRSWQYRKRLVAAIDARYRLVRSRSIYQKRYHCSWRRYTTT